MRRMIAAGVIRRGPQTSTVAVTNGLYIVTEHRDGKISKTITNPVTSEDEDRLARDVRAGARVIRHQPAQ